VEPAVFIRAPKEEMGKITKEVFDTFDPENISISDPDMEEVITKIFQQNK